MGSSFIPAFPVDLRCIYNLVNKRKTPLGANSRGLHLR